LEEEDVEGAGRTMDKEEEYTDREEEVLEVIVEDLTVGVEVLGVNVADSMVGVEALEVTVEESVGDVEVFGVNVVDSMVDVEDMEGIMYWKLDEGDMQQAGYGRGGVGYAGRGHPGLQRDATEDFDREKRGCNRCGEKGHWVRDCPLPCGICMRTGHTEGKCPRKGEAVRNRDPIWNPQIGAPYPQIMAPPIGHWPIPGNERPQNQQPQNLNALPEEGNKQLSAYTGACLPEPVVTGQVGKDYRAIRFLLDTGSKRNLIEAGVVKGIGKWKDVKEDEDNVKFTTANKGLMRIHGVVELEVV
jgi:hypothetical protein